MMEKPIIDFDDLESIKKFIEENESNLYEGKNIDGEDVIVTLEQGAGMEVRVKQENGWWRIHEFDKDGYVISETFERGGK